MKTKEEILKNMPAEEQLRQVLSWLVRKLLIETNQPAAEAMIELSKDGEDQGKYRVLVHRIENHDEPSQEQK